MMCGRGVDRVLAAGLIALAGWLGSPTADAEERQGVSVAQLSWLASCWESSQGDRRYEEQWMSPRGGMVLGMSRTVAGRRTSEFEFMHIREADGRLVFTARPSGQGEAAFPSR